MVGEWIETHSSMDLGCVHLNITMKKNTTDVINFKTSYKHLFNDKKFEETRSAKVENGTLFELKVENGTLIASKFIILNCYN